MKNLRSMVWPVGATRVRCKNSTNDRDVDVGGGAKIHDATLSYWLSQFLWFPWWVGSLSSGLFWFWVLFWFCLFSVLVLSITRFGSFGSLSCLFLLNYRVFSSFGSLSCRLSWFSQVFKILVPSAWFIWFSVLLILPVLNYLGFIHSLLHSLGHWFLVLPVLDHIGSKFFQLFAILVLISPSSWLSWFSVLPVLDYPGC